MALTQQELFNLQRFAPITRPTSPYSNFNNPPQRVQPLLSDIQAATRSSNPYASLMALTPQRSTPLPPTGLAGGFDPSIYKKLPGLITTPAASVSGGDGGGSGAGNDGAGSGGVGGLGVGSGQGLSSNLQQTALSLISLADKYPGFLPGGIVAKMIGLLGGVTADSQLSGLSDAQKALEAIDKQNAAALESGTSRTLDPYAGTKGVLSVSDADGNVRAFDPYAGDSAKDADKSKALADSGPAVAAAAVQAAADANAATGGGGGYGSGGVDAGPGGTGGGPGGFGPQYRGGLITPRDVKGPNPPGPDDGQASLDIGEYVIRKKAVQKYGANIFEQINAGKIPAKRLKSLLE